MANLEYYITNGKQFVKQNINGKYTLTTNIFIADSWNTATKAKSVLHNSIPPGMRFDLYVMEMKDGIVETKETISKKHIADCRKKVTEEKKDSYKLSKYSFEEDIEVQKMIQGFENVKDILNKYANNYVHKKLEEKTMTMNLIVEDIKHYHGKKALNAIDGFKLNRLEDKAIVKRISVKNQLEISKIINKHYASIIQQIEDICDTIDELRNQKYTPRILVDLFENDNLDIDVEV